MKRAGIVIIAVIALLLLWVIGSLVGNYNRLVTSNEGVTNRWSEVENQLQRRNDLIGNLVESVKGIATQEQEVFGRVADARAKLGGARGPEQTIEAGRAMDSALSRLLVVVENYPDLKSNAQFTQLMDELAGTENRLATARMRYNDEVRSFNVMVKRFPTNLYAGLFHFKDRPYYEAPEEAKQLPKVDFGGLRQNKP